MEINVTVNTDGIDMTTVIGEARTYDYDTEAYATRDVTLGERVAQHVTAALTKDDEYPGLRKKFLAVRDEEIREAVKPIVEQVILAPVQRTNTYGEPTGETTTLRELIVAETQKALTVKADNYGRGETVLQKFVREEISAAFKKELAETVAEEKAKVVAAVRGKAAELIAEAVKQGIGR